MDSSQEMLEEATAEVQEVLELENPVTIPEEKWSTIDRELVAAGHKPPGNFWRRNVGCINPAVYWNHSSGNFKKNQRRGL